MFAFRVVTAPKMHHGKGNEDKPRARRGWNHTLCTGIGKEVLTRAGDKPKNPPAVSLTTEIVHCTSPFAHLGVVVCVCVCGGGGGREEGGRGGSEEGVHGWWKERYNTAAPLSFYPFGIWLCPPTHSTPPSRTRPELEQWDGPRRGRMEVTHVTCIARMPTRICGLASLGGRGHPCRGWACRPVVDGEGKWGGVDGKGKGGG